MDIVELEPPRRDALRAELVARIPRWYSPWVHLAFPTLVGVGMIVGAALLIHDLEWWEVLFGAGVLVISNAAEWRAHKGILHKRRRFLELIFDRHTPEHHAIFVRDDMAIRSRKEFRLVLIPAYGIVAIFAATSPFTATFWFLGQHNLAAIFVMTTMFYVVFYEWLHLSFHLPPESFVGRLKAIRLLRRHHATHHLPQLMQTWNFNVSLPLWDWVRGTIYRGPEQAEA